nr:ribbon-helix-helix protein, CopG family [Clostridia bacterium]
PFTPTGNAVRDLGQYQYLLFVTAVVFRSARKPHSLHLISYYSKYFGGVPMQTQKDSVRMGVYISKKLQDRVDHAISKTDARSRSEFISDALELYLAWLDSYDYSKVLTPALESVIEAKIKETENHIAGVLFKQGVELAILMHVIAASQQYDPDSLEELRKHCVNEVRKYSGRYRFEDAVAFQNS